MTFALKPECQASVLKFISQRLEAGAEKEPPLEHIYVSNYKGDDCS